MRPLATIVADSFGWYGEDEHGGRVHDLLGTRCDPYINSVLAGAEYDFHCHSNLTRAVAPFGLAEADVHDVINIFQVTGLDAEGRYYMSPSPAARGDYLEFFAEQDLLMALSAFFFLSYLLLLLFVTSSCNPSNHDIFIHVPDRLAFFFSSFSFASPFLFPRLIPSSYEWHVLTLLGFTLKVLAPAETCRCGGSGEIAKRR